LRNIFRCVEEKVRIVWGTFREEKGSSLEQKRVPPEKHSTREKLSDGLQKKKDLSRVEGKTIDDSAVEGGKKARAALRGEDLRKGWRIEDSRG